MTVKGPDGLKSPLVGGQADLTSNVDGQLADRAKSLAQLRQVSDEAARQFADAFLPKLNADQTDGLFGPAFLAPLFGWIDRGAFPQGKKGKLPGSSEQEQLAVGFKQAYAQASHQLHRTLEALERKTPGDDAVLMMKEQELVPIQKALARIDEVLALEDRLTMLGPRSEMNRALRELDSLAKDVRAAIAPLVDAVELRDRLALGDKLQHLGQEHANPDPVDLAALQKTSPAAFARYRPGDVLIVGRDDSKKPIFGSMLDTVDTKDGPVARVLTMKGDRIEMRYVAQADVEALNALKLNDNYLIDGTRYWVAPDRERGVRVVTFDPARPGKAPAEVAPQDLAAKLGASQVAVPAMDATVFGPPQVIQVVQGHQTPRIMTTSNDLFDGAAWSAGHLSTNDDALRVGIAGDHYAAIVADQVGSSKNPAEVSTAIIDGIWKQMEQRQAGRPFELLEQGARAGAKEIGEGSNAATSLTAGIFTRTEDGAQLHVGHAGNTQLLVIRNGSVFFKTEPHVSKTGLTSSVGMANNPTRTIGADSARGAGLLEESTVALKKGDVVLLFSNGVRNMNLLDQTKNAGQMAQPHTEFTPFQLAEEVRGKSSPEEMVAAIRDLANERVRQGAGKAADLSLVALTIKE